MTKPTPYSNTDAAEENAVVIFRSLLDPKRVKADIRTRDKYPNVDGTIELVDQENRPFGKFDIQVKKIGDGKNSYSCPATLVGYSEVSTLPVLLICTDVSLSKVYWRHITSTMPEYKEDRDSFTIHFDEASDSITPDGVYIQKWEEIAYEYRKRIAQYPLLQEEVTNKLTLNNLLPKDIRLFQKYIDTINLLLDDDFLTIKKILFPDVWKLGVGVFDTNEQWVSFQIYKIPYEEPAPLVCKLEGKAFRMPRFAPYAISNHGTRRDIFSDPVKLAKSFVFDKVKQVVDQRLLPVHGYLTSTDIIFAFIYRYYNLLALSPELEHIDIEELSYALNNRMIGICASIAFKMADTDNRLIMVDLDNVEQFVQANKVEPISPGGIPIRFSVSSNYFPIRSVFDSLRNLMTTGVKLINRPFIPRRREPGLQGGWNWSGYKPEDENRNVALMLENAIPEYSDFVLHNRLKLPESRYLDKSTSIIFEYESAFYNSSWPSPILCEHHLDNQSQTLPKFSVLIISDEKSEIDEKNFPRIIYKGSSYKAISSSSGIANYLFGKTPMLNLLYRMLERDLSEQYGITSFSTHYD